MKRPDVYVDLDGRQISLVHLDAEERKLLTRILRRARTNPDWDAFDNWWTVAIPAFYQARGLKRQAGSRTIPWKIAQDQSSRIAVAAGLARLGDYRDELEELIHEQCPTRKAFCAATGLSEDMLSHVLAGQKDLSLASLAGALERIGYRLRITPGTDAVPQAASQRKRNSAGADRGRGRKENRRDRFRRPGSRPPKDSRGQPMIYELHYVGGPQDGVKDYAIRPYFRMRHPDGAVYQAEMDGKQPVMEWVDDKTRAITLHFERYAAEGEEL